MCNGQGNTLPVMGQGNTLPGAHCVVKHNKDISGSSRLAIPDMLISEEV